MMSRVATRVFLRPSRSPKWPNTAAPMGREKNAAAKVASEETVAIAGPMFGKNTCGKISAAAVP